MKRRNQTHKIQRRRQGLETRQKEFVVNHKEKKALWPRMLTAVGILIAGLLLILAYQVRNKEGLILPVALLIGFYLLIVLWLFPKLYTRSLGNHSLSGTQSEFERQKEKLKLEDDTRKTLAQIVGGAIILFGLIFTYGTYRLNVEKQDLDREGQITDRFTKAVGQLGEEDIAVRLGGLYALERIAKDSPKDHGTIMEIISAYIREKSRQKNLTQNSSDKRESYNNRSDKQSSSEKPSKTDILPERGSGVGTGIGPSDTHSRGIERELIIKTDIQAALTIIGRRIISQDLQGHKIDLNGAELRGADLRGANLNGADLSDADLRDAQAQESNLDGVDLSEADLRGARFSGAHLAGAMLIKADLRDAKFNNAILDEAYLNDSNLSNVDLVHAELKGANIGGAILRNAILYSADLKRTNISWADLSGADLTDADLKDANLMSTNLSGAYLKGADFKQAKLSNANLNDTYLTGAYLHDALGLSLLQMKSAIIDDRTILPKDLEPNREELREISRKKLEYKKEELNRIISFR